jgi:hypothetical protein
MSWAGVCFILANTDWGMFEMISLLMPEASPYMGA